MDNFSQKDDMTRIGGFIRPSSQEEERTPDVVTPPPEPSFPPPAPPQGPAFSPPPSTPAPGQAFPTPEQGSAFVSPDPRPSFVPPSPEPSFPSASPSFQAQNLSFSAPNPPTSLQGPSFSSPEYQTYAAPQDDMWFEVEQADPANVHPLREGQLVTVGRDTNQDIVIIDKTLSRNHLILQRSGDRIAVQVLGLNGLVYASQVYKSTNLEVIVPCSLTIGNVTCRIRKKIDNDATILMSDPAAIARHLPGAAVPPLERPSRSSPPVWPPSENQGPFGQPPANDKSFFAADQPNVPVFPTGQAEVRFPSTQPTQPAYEFRQPALPGQSGDRPFAGAASAPDHGKKGPLNTKLLLYGGLGLGLLLAVGVGLYFWLRSPASPPVESSRQTPPAATQAPPVAPPPPAKQGEPQAPTSSLHSHYLSKAKSYLTEGKPLDACDYLKDIPSTSPLRSEAVELAKQIPGCTL